MNLGIDMVANATSALTQESSHTDERINYRSATERVSQSRRRLTYDPEKCRKENNEWVAVVHDDVGG